MIRVTRPTGAALDRLLTAASSASLTYPEVGATRDDRMPDGYRHASYADVIGDGPDAFGRAAEGLRRWQAHAGIGAIVEPPNAPLEPGVVVVVVIRMGPARVLAPCRIVYTVDEPDRFGFAYGTLPGHPERGEEAFIVEREPSDAVHLTIRVFSRHDALMTRLAGPVGTLLQRRATRGYVEGLRRFVSAFDAT